MQSVHHRCKRYLAVVVVLDVAETDSLQQRFVLKVCFTVIWLAGKQYSFFVIYTNEAQ